MPGIPPAAPGRPSPSRLPCRPTLRCTSVHNTRPRPAPVCFSCAGRIQASAPRSPIRQPIVYWPVVGGAAVLTLTLVCAATAWVLSKPRAAAAQPQEPPARAAVVVPKVPGQEPFPVASPPGDPPPAAKTLLPPAAPPVAPVLFRKKKPRPRSLSAARWTRTAWGAAGRSRVAPAWRF